MVPQMFVVILALHAGLVIVSAFEITSHEPRTNSNSGVKYDEGDDVDLWCTADDWWEWCKFTLVHSDKSCELDWKKYALLDGKRTYVRNVTALDCDDFEGRFEYLGDYENYRVRRRLLGYLGWVGTWDDHVFCPIPLKEPIPLLKELIP